MLCLCVLTPVNVLFSINNKKIPLDSLKSIAQLSETDLIQLSNDALNSDLITALNYAELALELSAQNKNPLAIYDANNQLAKVFFYVGLFDQAATHWLNCQSIAILIKDNYLAAKSNFQLSALYIALEEYELAEKHILLAKDFFDIIPSKSQYTSSTPLIYNNLALIYEKTGRVGLAEKHFLSAINFAREHDLTNELKTSLSAYASFLLKTNQFAAAEKIINELQEINHNFEYSQQLEATSLIKLFRVYAETGKTASIDSVLLLGYQLSLSSGSVSLQKEYAYHIYLLEKKKENTADALWYKEVYDSLFNLENHASAKELLRMEELRKEFEKREANLTRNSASLKRKNRTIMLVSVPIILIFLSILIYKNRQNRRIKKEKERLNFSHIQITKEYEEMESSLRKNENLLAASQLQQITQSKRVADKIAQLKRGNTYSEEDSGRFAEILAAVKSGKEWIDFDIAMHQINDDFYQKLEAITPHLSINEKRLCVFLRFDMTSKEIIEVTGQSLRAIEISRTRLRKKLGLTNKRIQLNKFLQKL